MYDLIHIWTYFIYLLNPWTLVNLPLQKEPNTKNTQLCICNFVYCKKQTKKNMGEYRSESLNIWTLL